MSSTRNDLTTLAHTWQRTTPRSRRSPWVVALTAVVMLVALTLLGLTASSARYWLRGPTPTDLGNVRLAPAPPLPPLHDSFVTVRGLVPTRLAPVAPSASPAPDAITWLFYCPLADLVVYTRHEPTAVLSAASPTRTHALLVAGTATPDEVATDAAATGRLIAASDAPSALRPLLMSLADRLNRPLRDLRVVLDGATPATAAWAAWVWGLCLLSLVFVPIYALYHRRRPPPTDQAWSLSVTDSAQSPPASPELLAAHLAQAARRASRSLAAAPGAQKNQALSNISALLRAEVPQLLAANVADVAAAQAAGMASASLDRLLLTPDRIEAMAHGVDVIIALHDPVGAVEALEVRPNGLRVGRMRIPLGVIGIIYESRPNVTIDAGALCLKSGNAPILKGGKEAAHTNAALVALMRRALEQAGLPADCVQAVATSDRAVTDALIRRDAEIDLIIPRGGEALIRHITAHATVPVIQHYKGVCHAYVHADADLAMACAIIVNAKAQRPGVCNALETLLIHRDIAAPLLAELGPALEAAGVLLRSDPRARALWPGRQRPTEPATEADWSEEYLALILAVRVVDDYDAAVQHILRYSSGHTETLVTRDYALSQRFLREIPSSCVLVNASTRFNDGFELGLGAEIGISTSRLHAFGPMGLEELTIRKFIVLGDGQVRT